MKKVKWHIGIAAAVALLSLAACAGKEDQKVQQSSPEEIEDTLEAVCPLCELELEEMNSVDTTTSYRKD